MNKEILNIFKIHPQKLDSVITEKTKISQKKSILVDSDKLKIELQNDSKDLEFQA